MGVFKELSVFFPLYNEEENIENIVNTSYETFPDIAEKFEIILVNDGSTDRTKELAEEFASKHKEIKVVTQENKGYGGAVKRGLTEAKFDWVFFTDGDLQFKVSDIKKLIRYKDDNDLVIGFRGKRAEGFKRRFFTLALKIWNKIFFNYPFWFKDTDCPFKLIRKNVIDEIKPLWSNSGMISTELLLKSLRHGFKIKQVDIPHYERQFGEEKGNSFDAIYKMVIETVKLKWLFYRRYGLSDKEKLGLVSMALFLILFPISNSIDYIQNDEYNYYRHVENFLQGNFVLDPYMGATFYLQGLVGAAWARIFGFMKIPVLTLLVSVANFFVFSMVLVKFYKKSILASCLLGLLLFLNPWHFYSSFGFMTENYFLLFLLVSVYFILDYDRNKSAESYIFANFAIVLGYFVRQLSMITSLALAVYLLFTKRIKPALLQFLLFGALVFFHYKVFPLTPQMYEGNLRFGDLLLLQRTLPLVSVILIYLVMLLIPLVVILAGKISQKSKLVALSLLLSIPLFMIFANKFRPENVQFSSRTPNGDTFNYHANGEFPYLINIFTRTGFHTSDVSGEKYSYSLSEPLFEYWSFIAQVGLSVLIISILWYWRKYINFYSVFITGYIILMVLSPRVFDRYLLPLIPMAILLLVSWIGELGRLSKVLILVFIIFLGILMYEYEMDYHNLNKYLWSRSLQLVSQGIPANEINPTHPWRQLYPPTRETERWTYIFRYDPIEKRPEDRCCFEVIEDKKIKFPFSWYKNQNVYLYKRL